jgi:hypothetical protein
MHTFFLHFSRIVMKQNTLGIIFGEKKANKNTASSRRYVNCKQLTENC